MKLGNARLYILIDLGPYKILMEDPTYIYVFFFLFIYIYIYILSKTLENTVKLPKKKMLNKQCQYVFQTVVIK